MMQSASDRKDQIDALTVRYVTGELSEDVFTASLHRYLPQDEIRHIVLLNQLAHRQSLAYRRGTVS